MKSEPLCLEYFSGGVPSGISFEGTLKKLQTICNHSQDKPGINLQRELGLIGLLSYFEAFCKHHFASIINIELRFLEALKSHGQDTSIDAATLALFQDNIPIHVGFLLAEQYDFGTAKKINALYKALLNVTPFNKDELRQYDGLLRDRNLIVHHGGVYTPGHLQQKAFTVDDIKRYAFYDSVTLSQRDLSGHIDFIASIAQKIIRGSHGALVSFLEQHAIELSGERQHAVDYVGQWGLE